MSNQGPSIVHYEVYALNGQRWILQARFRRDEKEQAMEEAKVVENSLGLCAKVVRETYYPGNNACEEALVYASDKNFRPRQRAVQRHRALTREELAAESAGLDLSIASRSRSGKGSMGVFLKLLLVVAASLTIASGGTAILSNFWASVLQGQSSLAGFVSFVVIFLASAVPLAMTLIDWGSGTSPQATAKPQPAPVKIKEAKEAKETKPSAEEPRAIETPTEEPPPAPKMAEEPEPVPPEPAETEKATPEAATSEADEQPNETNEVVAAQRMTMMRFLSALLGEVKKIRPSLDAYNKFGVDLMLAGAIDVLGHQNGLDISLKRDLLKDTIEVMGTKSETAQAFADKYEDYLVEPKYLSMVQAGRTSMEALLAETETPFDQVLKLFDGWNKPQATLQAPSRIITVLFTDMVGSTNMTQAHGDQVAQDVVRRHNGIVRSALAEFAGKEIKHTGDGIMASFASAANGVEAAITIQRACARHNDNHPDQPLKLRIGLNAGEPIEEEDDLFGTTVQLSARVCAQADTDEILCTNVVRELSAGKGQTFEAKGSHELKGFKDPVTLYKVVWLAAEPSTEDAADASTEEPPQPVIALPTEAPAASTKPAAASTEGKQNAAKAKEAVRKEPKPATSM